MRRAPFGDNPSVGVVGTTTQRSILTAALTVFAEHGFHDTKVEHITAAAGCSRPAFYQYFASKQDVFWRLAGHLSRELATVADHLGPLPPDATGVDTLAAWLDELIDLHEAYHPVFVSFPAAFRDTAPDQPVPHVLADRVERVLDEAENGSAPGAVERRVLAEATSTVVLRTIHYWLLGLFSVPRPRFTRALAATVHRLAHGPVAGVNTGPLVDRSHEPAPGWPHDPADNGPDRPLRARGIATRQKLLDAASTILPRRGYHDTRVDDIVEEAGRSHGSFYRYFETTDHLFRELALEAAGQMAALIDSFPAAPGPPLRSWLVTWFDTYRTNGGVISAWQEIALDNPTVSTMSQDIVQVFLHRLERLVATRDFGDTEVDALVLLAILERLPYSVVVMQESAAAPAIAAAHHLIAHGVLESVPDP